MEKKPRPKKLLSKTECVDTACGPLHVTTAFLDGEVFEVFAHLDHANGCMKSQTEAVCRLVSSGRRYNVPLGEYVKQLANIRCGKPGPFSGKDRTLSCADGISKVLRRYLDDTTERGQHLGPGLPR